VTRPFRLTLLVLLLLAALTAALVPALLPPPAATTPTPHWQANVATVRGAYHVHSTRSDGSGTVEEIAAAAARAGLRFVIFTDHGDATRAPEPPRYRSGVLCIDGVEINTATGHLVALGLPPAPYPLAGSAEAVVEDVHRLGGMAIAAHPESPRASLQWQDWTPAVDGLEWLNADSEWRDELFGSLGRFLLTYELRPAETLAAMLDRPGPLMDRWDTLTRERRIVGLAGADAHARLGFRQQIDPYEEGWHLKVPSYEASFRAFGLRVVLDAPLSGDPVRDAEDVLSRLRWGRVYTVVDGLATPGAFEFTATSGGHSAHMGDYLELGGEVRLHLRMAAPAGTRMVVLRDGAFWFDTTEPEAHPGVPMDAAAYRVELYLPEASGQPPIPWMVSNPIYVGLRPVHAAIAPAAAPAVSARTSIATEAWVAEASPGSRSELSPRTLVDGVAAIAWQFALADGAVAAPYAAVRFPVAGLQGRDRLQLRARSSRPLRLSIQLRSSSRGAGERWGQTVYLDDRDRAVDVWFDRFTALGLAGSMRPPLDRVDALLLVVDTLNARPGDTGRIDIAELWLGQP
jgi:hypothetical protein